MMTKMKVMLLMTLWLLTAGVTNAEEDYTMEIHWWGSEYSGPIWMVHEGNTKGMVCADSWDDLDAKVACRQLGNYSDGLAYSHYPAYDSTSGIPYFTSQYQCTGNESRLAQCDHVEITRYADCKSGHHAGVLCYNNESIAYRLGGSHTQEGRVEVGVAGTWGTLCAAHWTDTASRVLCRAHGFLDGETLSPDTEGLAAPLPGPVWDPRFNCSGQEGDLNRCPHQGWVRGADVSCGGEGQAVAVFCKRAVALSGGNRSQENWTGAVEVFDEGRWERVCDTNFTETEATAACLAANPELPHATVIQGSFFDDLHLPNITSFHCAENNVSITPCVITGTGTCPSGRYASVMCSNVNPKAGKDQGMRWITLVLSLSGVLVLLCVVVVGLICFRRHICASCDLKAMFGHERFESELPSSSPTNGVAFSANGDGQTVVTVSVTRDNLY